MNIVIVGYGLAGRLCALALAPHANICVVTEESQEARDAAGWKAAAMLAPVAESVDASELVVAMGWHSMGLWHKLVQKLPQSVFMQQSGSLVLAHQQDLPLMAQFRQQVKPNEKHRITPLGRHQIHQLEPELQANLQHGLLLSEEGQIDNIALLRSIDTLLIEQNLTIYWQCPVTEINPAVLAAQCQLSSVDWVIDCRGLGAKSDWKQPGSSSGSSSYSDISQLRGVRGEVMRVYAPDVTISHPIRLMHPRYPLYVVPKPNHHFVLGATQIESEDDSPISVRSTLDLLSAAFSIHGGFGEARIINAQSGLRPTFNDHQPKIKVNSQQRIISVNGLFRHGYLIGPVISELVKHIALNRVFRPSLSAFTDIIETNPN